MEGADQVLAVRRVDAGLAADRGIDLRQQRRRDLHEVHAAPGDRGGEAGEVADDAAAERDDEVAALEPGLEQRPRPLAEPRERFGRLAVRHDDGAWLEARARRASAASRGNCALALRVGDDAEAAAGEHRLEALAGGLEQTRADDDVVGALARAARGRSHGGSVIGMASARRCGEMVVERLDDLVRPPVLRHVPGDAR